jgi:pyruvate/2-oxoglutarate dehydrogenase complex dihydrolipoamide dehydrogenase (E3) component
VSDRQVRVGERILEADRIFIATGMRPLIPPVNGLEAGPFLTNETVMELAAVPEHLIVIGGGYIGCELGQAFRRFGSQVTIVQRGERLIGGEDEDASTVLGRAFADEGIDVLSKTEVRSVSWSNQQPSVEVVGPRIGRRRLDGSHPLVAAGRRPNTDTLDLPAAGAQSDGAGFVLVDERLATSVSRDMGRWGCQQATTVHPRLPRGGEGRLRQRV